MAGSYLLDTNILIALMTGDTDVLDHLASAEEVFTPAIAIGELCFGARKSSRASENLLRIDELASSCKLLGCDLDTAKQYGAIKSHLRDKGKPIPENDIWIAAVALQYGLTIVSRDEHFAEIEHLLWEKW